MISTWVHLTEKPKSQVLTSTATATSVDVGQGLVIFVYGGEHLLKAEALVEILNSVEGYVRGKEVQETAA